MQSGEITNFPSFRTQKEQEDTKAQYDELIKQAGDNKELVTQLQDAKNAKLKEGQDKYNQETLDAAKKLAEDEAKIEEEKVKAKAAAINGRG